jgi:hypothetical protein
VGSWILVEDGPNLMRGSKIAKFIIQKHCKIYNPKKVGVSSVNLRLVIVRLRWKNGLGREPKEKSQNGSNALTPKCVVKVI